MNWEGEFKFNGKLYTIQARARWGYDNLGIEQIVEVLEYTAQDEEGNPFTGQNDFEDRIADRIQDEWENLEV